MFKNEINLRKSHVNYPGNFDGIFAVQFGIVWSGKTKDTCWCLNKYCLQDRSASDIFFLDHFLEIHQRAGIVVVAFPGLCLPGFFRFRMGIQTV